MVGKKFKDYFDTYYSQMIAEKIKKVYPLFKHNEFIDFIGEKFVALTFLERQDLFAEALKRFLTNDYQQDIAVFMQILGPELPTSAGMFSHGWWLWPIGRYVEKNGVENLDISLNFIYELTKRFTGEFAIRPLIEIAPKKTMRTMLIWSTDENVHVRRLASEGMRIQLPWAKKSFAAIKEITIFESILDNLKNDKEKFVQKSVGNNLNDLMKEKPKLAKKIIERWQNSNPGKETLWIIKHGLRGRIKK